MLVKVLAVVALEILMSFDQEKSSFDPLEYTSLLNNLVQLAGPTVSLCFLNQCSATQSVELAGRSRRRVMDL